MTMNEKPADDSGPRRGSRTRVKLVKPVPCKLCGQLPPGPRDEEEAHRIRLELAERILRLRHQKRLERLKCEPARCRAEECRRTNACVKRRQVMTADRV